MQVFNSQVLSHKQRWWLALFVGIIASILIGIVFGWINFHISFELEILYIGVGYLIGRIIQYLGHGVDKKFSILAMVLTLFAFLISDLISLFGPTILIRVSEWPVALPFIFAHLFQTSISSILSLLFRIVGAYFAYQEGRIL